MNLGPVLSIRERWESRIDSIPTGPRERSRDNKVSLPKGSHDDMVINGLGENAKNKKIELRDQIEGAVVELKDNLQNGKGLIVDSRGEVLSADQLAAMTETDLFNLVCGKLGISATESATLRPEFETAMGELKTSGQAALKRKEKEEQAKQAAAQKKQAEEQEKQGRLAKANGDLNRIQRGNTQAPPSRSSAFGAPQGPSAPAGPAAPEEDPTQALRDASLARTNRSNQDRDASDADGTKKKKKPRAEKPSIPAREAVPSAPPTVTTPPQAAGTPAQAPTSGQEPPVPAPDPNQAPAVEQVPAALPPNPLQADNLSVRDIRNTYGDGGIYESPLV